MGLTPAWYYGAHNVGIQVVEQKRRLDSVHTQASDLS